MRKTILSSLVLFWAIQFCTAEDQLIPTLRIVPEDVTQDTVRQWRMSTNKYAVSWAYTEAGAKKTLHFREGHKGEGTRTVIGSFESQSIEDVFRPMPPTFTNYTQWKEGWLKYRTDKLVGVSEEDAKKIAGGLKSK